MPSSSIATKESSNDRIVVRCGPVRKLLIRPKTHQDALNLVLKTFILSRKASQIAFSAKLSGLEVAAGDSPQAEFTPITELNWETFRSQIKVLRVMKQNKVERVVNAAVEPLLHAADCKRTIEIVHGSYLQTYDIEATAPFRAVFRAFATSVSIPLEDLKFYSQTQAVKLSDTPSSLALPQTQATTLRAVRYYIRFTVNLPNMQKCFIRIEHGACLTRACDVIAPTLGMGADDLRLLDGTGIRVKSDEIAGDIYRKAGGVISCLVHRSGEGSQ
ncbi:hypothetical protein FS837_000008 [Tulasnella sp. UAMH 9824]|nr:hypothetical protein FS837_000008 [Tulasnella sp. UAMH 9824]